MTGRGSAFAERRQRTESDLNSEHGSRHQVAGDAV
jgi:hypothetical protein